jgi:hypothetical protein
VPTKRRRIGRAPVPDVPRWYLERFLPFGEGPGDPEAEADPFETWLISSLALESSRVLAARVWGAHREQLLRWWIRARPGTRPWAWWALEAPPADGEAHRAWPQCDPRQRAGGTGVAVRDRYPCYLDGGGWGLPVSWIAATLDPADPPRFESEPAYLRRHGLLLPPERRRLTAADFQPVSLELTPDTADLQDHPVEPHREARRMGPEAPAGLGARGAGAPY